MSPERPVPVLKPIKAINVLGGAANVANNIKSIGGSPFLISKLSNDATCKTIKKLLNINKINFKNIINKEYSSPIKKRIVQNDHQFCRVDDETYAKLKKKDEIKIIQFIIHKIKGSDNYTFEKNIKLLSDDIRINKPIRNLGEHIIEVNPYEGLSQELKVFVNKT